MRLFKKITAVWLGLVFLFLSITPTLHAQTISRGSPIVFTSFNGSYYLSRDANGRSLLTSEEVILADFPGDNNFYGITRVIPKTYLARSVKVKVLSVTDAAGGTLPYKKTSDKSGNLVITTGDPAIAIYGPQTFRINYQTQDVININSANNQFLLDINGRGWSQPIGKVVGNVYMPNSFAASLIGKPECYIGYLDTKTYDCSVNSSNQPKQIVVTAKSDNQVAANHTLVLKLNFKAATFTNKNHISSYWLAAISIMALIAGIFSAWKVLRR